VVCLGEALVDFLPDRRGQRVRDVSRWHPCLGGAPANVSVGVARLGGHSALVGCTGADEFGSFLKEGLAAEGVDVRWLRQTEEGKTGLGFVSLTESGERSFTFYRTRSAETFLDTRDTIGALEALKTARVLHVGTNSLVQPKARAAVAEAVRQAHARGAITSTDPNLRLHLWPEPEVLRHLVDELTGRCAVVKLSEEEIEFVTGTARPEAALDVLAARGVTLAVVTLAAKGALLRFGGRSLKVAAPRSKVVDTTGAGDGFTSGLLFGLSHLASTRAELAALDPKVVTELGRFACVVGSRVVTKLGAVAGLPRLREVRAKLPRPLR
jgi:fructokinase